VTVKDRSEMPHWWHDT